MSALNVVPARGEPLRTEALRLDRNERLHPDARLARALAGVPPAALARYPDARRLERQIAELWGVEPERVLATAGGDDAIDRVCRLCLRERPELVTATPTFEMFPLCAELAGGRMIAVPSLEDPAPLEGLRARFGPRTGLVVAITPHNPTGAAISAETLVAIAESLPRGIPLLADLAYAEFADADPTPRLLARDDVLVVRTLSKAWGLAGLRVGYVLGAGDVIARLRESGPPFPLAGPSIWMAEAALALGPTAVEPHVAAVRAERDELAGLLLELGAEPFPSQANFVLARVASASGVRERLRELGVRVRAFDHSPDLLRITLPGDRAAFETLERALRVAFRERRPS